MEKFLKAIAEKFEVSKVDIKEFSKMKVGPMKFQIECYDVKGVGRLSFMKGTAMLGLMKMDTMMFTSLEKDVPLYSYDRIKVLKNDTLIIEMYNTCKELPNLDNLKSIKNKLNLVDRYELKPAWYDEIRVEDSIAFKGKKKSLLFDDVSLGYIKEFSDIISKAKDIGVTEKKKLQAKYVDGLLEKGGTSTDMFIKSIGKEKTKLLYEKFLFGTE